MLSHFYNDLVPVRLLQKECQTGKPRLKGFGLFFCGTERRRRTAAAVRTSLLFKPQGT